MEVACAAPFAIEPLRNLCAASSAIAKCAASTPAHLHWHLSTSRRRPSRGCARSQPGIAPPRSQNAAFARSVAAPSACVRKCWPTVCRYVPAASTSQAASRCRITSGHRLKCIGSTSKTRYRPFPGAVRQFPPKQRDNICENFNLICVSAVRMPDVTARLICSQI